MKSVRLLAATALAGTTLLGAGGPAFAQDTAPVVDAETAAAEDAAADDGDIVVTGTRIVAPGLTATVPVTSIGVTELTDTGNLSIGDELNKLPAFSPTFSQANSTGFIGTSGLNLLDLRGLGTPRTLVLVNGRRHVTSSPGIPQRVDVNMIPTDLIERVDVVTGGNSAIYGSDAVAGVVNFILKRDFEGIRVRGQSGISEQGDRGAHFISLTAGRNFGEGRGNIAGSVEYSFTDDFYYDDREELYGAFAGRKQFNLTENTTGEAPAGNGIPDQTFLENVKNNNISEGGTFAATCPAAVPGNAANAARRALNCTGQRSPTGAELGFSFMFQPDGTLVPNNCTVDLRAIAITNNCVGGLGSTLRQSGQLAPRLERKAANLLFSYEVAPAFRPFLEAKFVRIDANQEGQPTSIANLQGTYSLNNPFLTAQARDVLVRSLAPGATTFSIQRFNVDFGGRGEELRRDVYRIVGGADGTFNDDWRHEVALNYGEFDSHLDTVNRIVLAKFVNSANAVRNAAGQIVCGINADANTANDDPACVPINVFGAGNPSQAALDYFEAEQFRDEKAKQYNAVAYLSGDMSQLFELPGGPVNFVVGGEFRREEAFAAWDAQTTAGLTDLNTIPVFDPPALEVLEAFAELRIPILADMPFFEELTLEAAGRVSDYNSGAGTTGTVFTYNIGGIWSPVRDIRIRGGYARSIRAPTQLDLFRQPGQTFLNGLIDPCAQNNINSGTANRVANCAAAGVPVTEVVNGVTVPWTNLPASGIRGLNGSNPNLNEEKGTSWTIGAVIQPSFLPGFSLTVDYYDITVDNVIASLGGQTIIDLCYDSATGLDNQYCAAVFRRPDGTFLGQSNRNVGGTTVQYTVGPNDNSFLSGPFNFAKLEAAGVDFEAAYRTDLGGVQLDTRAILSWNLKRDNFTNVTDPTFRDRTLGELGTPEVQADWNVKLDFGQFDFFYNLRYIGEMTTDFYESFFPLDGRAPQDADKFPFENRFTPETFYHAIRVGFEPQEGYRFYAGVDNLLDTPPPYGFDGTCGTGGVFTCSASGIGTAIFDNFGRYFYAGFEFKF